MAVASGEGKKSRNGMTAREQIEERLRQWKTFNRWELDHPAPQREPAEILADLGAILEWASPETLASDPDPEKRGIQAMKAALAHLKQDR
jgi:hypothetical protein